MGLPQIEWVDYCESMKDTRLYAQMLGIQKPWNVSQVQLSLPDEIEVRVQQTTTRQRCPECNKVCPGYDKRERRWRHLDTMQLKTLLVAEVPRIRCAEHGVLSVRVPWAEPGSGFTALFEALVIDWLHATTTAAVSKRLRLSWNAVDGIMQRAVKRGLSRRQALVVHQLSADETAYRKGHQYITVVTDQEQGAAVYVCEDRTTDSLKAFYDSLTADQRDGIESVCMDMWPAYIRATRDALDAAEHKIAFDRFHVSQYMGKAVDQVRRREHRGMMKHGDERLKGSKYAWLRNRKHSTWHQRRQFTALRTSTLKTARAWAMKETAQSLWDYRQRSWAHKGWSRLINWMARSRLTPMQATSKTLRKHLWGILNAIILGVNNAHAESMNSRIKTVKIRARGFRNKQRFINAIYFHLGGLQLYPTAIQQ